jgi:glycosyltransferase involved in cell wall biosynthesis
MKKKILHLITGLEYGGAEMMLLKILPPLNDEFEHSVVCIRGRGPIGKKLTAAGISVSYLDLRHPLDWRIIPRFHALVKSVQPDLLVTYLIHADLFGRVFGRLFGVKKIYCSVRVKLIQPIYLPLLVLDGLTGWFIDGYHFNSSSVASLYQKYFFVPSRKITLIPNGLDLRRFIPNNTQRQEMRAALTLSDKFVIGCNARLEKQKGVSYLLEAFAVINIRHPETRLIIINDGNEKSRLIEQAQAMGMSEKIQFLGRRDDVPELLNAMDLFVFPTLFEGMANALMEAMAVGLPIITTNIPENKELITHAINGQLVAPKNVDQIIQEVYLLISDEEERNRIGIKARETAEKKFSLEDCIDRYRVFFSR